MQVFEICFNLLFQMRRSLHLVARLALISFVAVNVCTGQQKADSCDPSYCRLPDCYCGGTDIPGGYKPEEIPQFVLLTFDDAVNSLNEKFFQELFKDRLNPNGCPIKVRNIVGTLDPFYTTSLETLINALVLKGVKL